MLNKARTCLRFNEFFLRKSTEIIDIYSPFFVNKYICSAFEVAGFIFDNLTPLG